MSAHWEQYPRTIGRHPGFVAYDHGVQDDIESLPFPYFVSFSAQLHDPDDRGLPRNGELEPLNALEEFLTAQLGVAHGLQVGRVTAQGRRLLHYYTELDEAACERIARQAAQHCGYELALFHQRDAERTHYWDELYPGDDDWQVIQDLRVEGALREQGDTLQQPRDIEHWVYFRTAAQREVFVRRMKASFLSVELSQSSEPQEHAYAAKFTHHGLPDHRSINATSLMLSRAAHEHDADYDGWGCLVCK